MRVPVEYTRTGRWWWLVDLRFAGGAYYLTDREDVDVPTAAGGVIRYRAGLAPLDVDEVVDLWTDSPSLRSVALEVWLRDVVADLVSRGHHLSEATAILSAWYDGQTHEERRIVLEGRLVQPSYGGADDPLRAALEENPFDDSAVVPPLEAVISEETTWPAAGTAMVSESQQGSAYPLVIGRPGAGNYGGGLAFDYTLGSPGLWALRSSSSVPDSRIIVAGHPIVSSSVRLFNATAGGTTSPTVNEEADGLGRVVSYVYPSSLGWADTDEIWVGWPDGGGLRNPYGEGPLRGAGDVIRYLLTLSTVRIDVGRLANLTRLNAFLVDTFINDHVSPLSWISSRLAPFLPISAVTGPDGLYFLVWRSDLRADEAVGRVSPELGAARESLLVESSAGDVYNDFKMSFNKRGDTNAFIQYRTLSAERTAGDAWSAESLLCRRSQAVYGRRSLVVESEDFSDPRTVGLILQYYAARYTFPSVSIWYAVPDELDYLVPGDVVVVDDPDVYLEEAPALVVGKTKTEAGAPLVRLHLHRHPRVKE